MSAQIQYRRGTDPKTEDERVALGKETFKHDFLDNLFCVQGKIPALATRHDYYLALAYTVRDRMLHRWISTAETYTRHGSRTVAYLSAEFLMGPASWGSRSMS
jgi:starch phosphorylase